MKKHMITSITLSSAFALAGATAVADQNPFQATQMESGYQLAMGHKGEEGKCGEGKCGGHDKEKKKDREGACGERKGEEGKCGEGKCGGKKKDHEGKCGGDKKDGEGKCGEGACGAA